MKINVPPRGVGPMEIKPAGVTVKPETGTLAELGVQPGDVVECVETAGFHWWTAGKKYEVTDDGTPADNDGDTYGEWDDPQSDVTFRIISRANQPDDKPKTWGEMTDVEKVRALREKLHQKSDDAFFDEHHISDILESLGAINPEPEKGTVTLQGGEYHDAGFIFECGRPDQKTWYTHTLTIPTEDGQPIPAVYRSEAGDELIVKEND